MALGPLDTLQEFHEASALGWFSLYWEWAFGHISPWG